METLDQMLAAEASGEYAAALQALFQQDSFTKEARDTVLDQVRNLGKEMTEKSISFVNSLLETEIEGKSVLYWRIYQQFLLSELEMLKNFRDELDLTRPEAVSDLPIDYDWLGNKIRAVYSELGKLNLMFGAEEAQELAEAVEEL